MTRRFGMLNRTTLLVALAAIVLFSNAVAAQSLISSLKTMCTTVKSIVPVVALLMFIMAGGIYAIGQVLGAETRARASVWATAMLVGGVIGLVIAASAGFLLKMFASSIGDVTTSLNVGATC